MSFDSYENTFHILSAEKFGPSKNLISQIGLEKEFNKIQHLLRLWKIPTLNKDWVPSNHPMMVIDNHTIIARCSIFYAFYMQGLKIESPIYITKKNNEFVIAPGYNKYILNKVFPQLNLPAFILDFEDSDIKNKFSEAELINDTNIVMKAGYFNGPAYWYFIQKHKNTTEDYDTISSKFSNQDTREEYWTYRLEFLNKVEKFKKELTFYYNGSIVAELTNGKPKLNIELYNLAGVCQFIVKYFCDYDNFCLEDQYRIME